MERSKICRVLFAFFFYPEEAAAAVRRQRRRRKGKVSFAEEDVISQRGLARESPSKIWDFTSPFNVGGKM